MEGIHRVSTSSRRWCAVMAMRAARLAVCTRGNSGPTWPGCSAHVAHVARAPGTVHVAHFSDSGRCVESSVRARKKSSRMSRLRGDPCYFASRAKDQLCSGIRADAVGGIKDSTKTYLDNYFSQNRTLQKAAPITKAALITSLADPLLALRLPSTLPSPMRLQGDEPLVRPSPGTARVQLTPTPSG